MTTYYAIFRRPGSRWNPDKGVREQPLWDEHARFMDDLFAAGSVVLAGPFADRSGSMVIVRGASVHDVRKTYSRDPWTVEDVLDVSDVKEWHIFLDGSRLE